MAQKMSIDMLEEQLLCPICLEMFKEPLMLQCGHLSCQPWMLSLPRVLEGQLLCFVCCQGVACNPLAPSIVLACVIKVLRSQGKDRAHFSLAQCIPQMHWRRTMECFGLGGALKTISFHPPVMGMDTFH